MSMWKSQDWQKEQVATWPFFRYKVLNEEEDIWGKLKMLYDLPMTGLRRNYDAMKYKCWITKKLPLKEQPPYRQI